MNLNPSRTAEAVGGLRSVAAIAGFAFLVHFPWEFIQAPLFVGMSEASHWRATLLCTRATLGDAVIAVLAYSAVAVVARRPDWLTSPTRPRVVGYVVAGLVITFVVELASVYVLDRWSYADSMPVIAGIGLSPLLQWVLLPLVTLWLARRHVD